MSGQTDSMILRLEKEVEERSSLIEGVVGAAQDAERDLTQNEQRAHQRGPQAHRQHRAAARDALRVAHPHHGRPASGSARSTSELSRLRTEVDNGPVEYRTAGAYLIDQYNAVDG